MEQRIILTFWAIALSLALFPRKIHESVKIEIHDILATVWLGYSIYYKDYIVMLICIIILTLSFNPRVKKT